MSGEKRKYSRDEVAKILERALERQHGASETTHDELVETAREAGIDTRLLEEAAREVTAKRAQALEREAVLGPARQRFNRHLAAYVIVNVALALMCLPLPGAGKLLFLPVLAAWGIGVAFNALAVFYPNEREVQKRVEKMRRRNERERIERGEETLARSKAEIRAAVGSTVARVLTGVADQIDGAVGREGRGRERDRERVRVDTARESERERVRIEREVDAEMERLEQEREHERERGRRGRRGR